MTDLLPTLQEFYREKLSALVSHQAAARLVSQYDFNNAYQYIINREETQLSWLGTAIVGLGGTVETQQAEPDRAGQKRARGGIANILFEEDATAAQAFVDRWRPRVEQMPNARQRNMLRVILGETLEQKRFFEQARAGDIDLLGRRGKEAGERVGEVLPSRWLE